MSMDLRTILDVAEAYASLGSAIQEQVQDLLNGDEDEYGDPAMTAGAAGYVRDRLVPALRRLGDLGLDTLRDDIDEYVRRIPKPSY